MKAVDPSYYLKYGFQTIKKWKKIGDIIEPVMIQKSLMKLLVTYLRTMYVLLGIKVKSF